MKNEKVSIVICLGSSCFSRGNRETLEVIKEYLKEKNVEDRVAFKGQLCSGSCNMGPVVWIDGKKYEGVTPTNVLPILNEIFK